MGLISPTPRQGSWVEGDAFTGPWQDQPRQGSWVESDSFSGPWTPQPRQGSWVTMDGVTFDPWVPPTDGWSVGFLKF